MKRMRKFVSLFLMIAVAVSIVPGKVAKATELESNRLVSATSTTATVSWSVSEAQQWAAERSRTLVGFKLSWWNVMSGVTEDTVAATLDATTSTYTYTNMSPTGYYLLYVSVISRDTAGNLGENLYWNSLTYDPSLYGGGSGSGSSSGMTTGGSGSGTTSTVNAIVANATITGVGYYQYGFGKKTGLSIKWKGYTDVTGYQADLYSRKGKLVESRIIPNQYINYCTFSKANTQNCYYVKVRCYYTSNGVTTWSKWSSSFNAVPQARITSGKKAIGSHSIRLTWKKVSGATKYVIYARKGGKKKWTKVKTLKSNKKKYTFTKLKGKRIKVDASGYDLQVRTTAKVNGKTVKSSSVYYTNYYRI